MSDEDFQTNKEVILNLIDRIDNLEVTLRETERIIHKYNGLRKTLEEVEEDTSKNRDKINKFINEKNSDRSLLIRLSKYGGWILGILSFIGYLVEKM